MTLCGIGYSLCAVVCWGSTTATGRTKLEEINKECQLCPSFFSRLIERLRMEEDGQTAGHHEQYLPPSIGHHELSSTFSDRMKVSGGALPQALCPRYTIRFHNLHHCSEQTQITPVPNELIPGFDFL